MVDFSIRYSKKPLASPHLKPENSTSPETSFTIPAAPPNPKLWANMGIGAVPARPAATAHSNSVLRTIFNRSSPWLSTLSDPTDPPRERLQSRRFDSTDVVAESLRADSCSSSHGPRPTSSCRRIASRAACGASIASSRAESAAPAGPACRRAASRAARAATRRCRERRRRPRSAGVACSTRPSSNRCAPPLPTRARPARSCGRSSFAARTISRRISPRRWPGDWPLPPPTRSPACPRRFVRGASGAITRPRRWPRPSRPASRSRSSAAASSSAARPRFRAACRSRAGPSTCAALFGPRAGRPSECS